MIDKLIELLSRTAVNAATGHLDRRRKPTRQPRPKPAPADAWIVGREVRLSGPDGASEHGAVVALGMKDLNRSLHITGAPGCGKTSAILGLIEFLLGDEEGGEQDG